MHIVLDIAVSPMEEFIFTMSEGGWIIALSAIFVIGAIAGIILFTKNKNDSKGEKK